MILFGVKSKHNRVIRKVMPCWSWVAPSFDVSSPPSFWSQSHEILLNKGMKYWDSVLNAPSSRTFIIIVHIVASTIGWKHSRKKRTRQTQFSTKFAIKLSFMFHWSPMSLFFLFFEISSLMWLNKGSNVVFSWFYR